VRTLTTSVFPVATLATLILTFPSARVAWAAPAPAACAYVTYPPESVVPVVPVIRVQSSAQAAPARAGAGAGARAGVSVQRPVPRVVRSSPIAPRRTRTNIDRGPGIVPWVIVGGTTLALIAGFLILQGSSPAAPVIQVVHPPSGASP
jgi:hypothetical protein